MTYRTPYVGPLAGRMCRVEPDGSLVPLDPVDSARVGPSVALPEVGVQRASSDGIEAGEISGYDTRSSIAKLARQLQQNGFGNAEARARQAAARWDRGIRDGSITRTSR